MTALLATCKTPDCSLIAEEGKFCPVCRIRLDRIRGGLEEFEFNKGNSKKRRKGSPTCCTPGCFEPRVPPAAFCLSHEGSGYSDD